MAAPGGPFSAFPAWPDSGDAIVVGRVCRDPTPINLPIYFQAGPGRNSVTAELALLACPLPILISLAIDTVLMGSIPGRIRAAVEADTVARLSKTIAAGHLSGVDTGSGLATASAALVWVFGGSDARRLDPRPRFVQAELTRLGLRKAALVRNAPAQGIDASR